MSILKGFFLAVAAALVAVVSLLRLANSGRRIEALVPTPQPPRPVPPRRSLPPRKPVPVPRPARGADWKPIAFPLGRRPAEGGRPFVFSEWHASHHQLILGTTGSGKSRYAELQCRFLLDSMRGFCFIDPDGDTSENLLAYAGKKSEDEGTDAIFRQVVYIELSSQIVFACDPFAVPDFSHLPPEHWENAYRAWLPVKVDAFCEIVRSKQGAGDFTGMARLQRVLRTVLYAVGTAIDESGRHLPLSEVFALLDCDHPRHAMVYAVVAAHLPADVRSEFERWHGADRRQRLQETESTLNRLRSLLSPLVMAIFTEPARRIDFRRVIDQRQILLVNLRQSDFLSADQQRAIATLFVHEIWTACKVAERADRPVAPYYVYIDEAHMLMETAGGDLQQILTRGRKYKTSLTLIGQYLGQFRNERVDLIHAILNLCRSFACFQHSSPDDLEILKQYFGYPNLDFTELRQVMDRPDGYELLKLKEFARNFTVGANWNAGMNANHSQGESSQETHSQQHSTGTSTAAGRQQSTSNARVLNGGVTKQFDIHGSETGRTKTGGGSTTEGTTTGASLVRTDQVSDTTGLAIAQGRSEQFGTGVSAAVGGNQAVGFSVSERTAVIPKTREEWHPAGRLRMSVEDQFHRVAQRISALRNRQAMVRLFGEEASFRMDVGEVGDVYPDAREMAERLRAFKARVYASHNCYFVPDLSPAAESRRLDTWLRSGAQDPKPADGGPPQAGDNGYGN